MSVYSHDANECTAVWLDEEILHITVRNNKFHTPDVGLCNITPVVNWCKLQKVKATFQ